MVVKPEFNAWDLWNRYEWQGRGSTHSHGFVWIASDTLSDVETSAGPEEFANFWTKHIFVMPKLDM